MRDDILASKARQGSLNYQSGLAAEDCALGHYTRAGAELLARRWRGRAGEIDLIVRVSGIVVFVEVKAAATFDLAAQRLSPNQFSRIASAAEEFLASQHFEDPGIARVDAALVDGTGRVDIIENVTLA